MGRVSINHSINISTPLQAARDNVNKCWYVTSEDRVVSQHHLLINLDLSTPSMYALVEQTTRTNPKHYADIELTSPRPIRLMPNARLGRIFNLQRKPN